MSAQIDRKNIGLLLVILAAACWSTSGIYINRIITKTGLTPIGLAFWRDLFTTLALGLLLLVFNPKAFKLFRKDLPWLVRMGSISIGVFHVLWNSSVMSNGVGVATILQSNAPVFVTLAAYFLWKETLTPKKLIALTLSVAGTVLLSDIQALGNTNVTSRGILVGLASAITYGTISLLGKKLRASYSAWTILFYIFLFASLALLPLQFREQNLSFQMLKSVSLEFLVFVFIPTILGFGLYNTALKYLQAGIASITATSEVPFAAITSYFFLGERLGVWQIVGGLLIVGGVTLVSSSNRKKAQLSTGESLLS